MHITGRELRIERRTAEVTVTAIAARMGLSRQALWAMERSASVKPERAKQYREALREENIREAFDKLPAGHFAGERNGRARLNWDAVRAIRARVAKGETQAALAKEYGVTQGAVSQIVRGKKWREPAAQQGEKAA